MRDRYAWELAMGFLAIIYVAVGFAVEEVDAATARLVESLDLALTVVFVAEFSTRLGASHDRRRYLRGHWIDALALLPVARGVRIARLARVLRMTRFFAGAYRAVVRAQLVGSAVWSERVSGSREGRPAPSGPTHPHGRDCVNPAGSGA